MTDRNDDRPPPLRLGDISTSWRRLNDPLRFVMTYGAAVRAYLLALLADGHEADEVLQELLVKVTERGFPTASPDRGRFRDYLKAVVRNAARSRLRPGRTRQPDEGLLEAVPARELDAERAWRDEWRRCVLEGALRALERHERASGRGNLGFTVVQAAIEHQDEDSPALAARVSVATGRELTAEAFRKQLSRARETFARLLAAEVQETLDGADADEVRDELAALGLYEYVRPYLSGG